MVAKPASMHHASSGRSACWRPSSCQRLSAADRQIELGENVAEARRQHLLALEPAAETQQGHVDGERKRRGVASELPVERRRARPHPAPARTGRRSRRAPRRGTHWRSCGRHGPRTPGRRHRGRARGPVSCSASHFLEQIGMAADRALAELDQAAGDDVGALDRDADGHRAIEAAEIVERAFMMRLAAVHVHGVVDRRRAAARSPAPS